MAFAEFPHQQPVFADANGSSNAYAPSSPTSLHEAAKVAYYPPNQGSHPTSCEIKPRLTKDQHDILEAHYQQQNKPNTNTKRALAESLNVSLDKVNNWFQNRRAKSKQDAKKQAGALSFYHTSQQPQSQSHVGLDNSSDTDVSPTSYAAPDVYNQMRQWLMDEHSEAMGLGPGAGRENSETSETPYQNSAMGAEYQHRLTIPHNGEHLHLQHMFDSPQELNRRTLTQEQFDAFARNGGMMNSAGHFEDFHTGFSGDHDILSQVFPEVHDLDYKQHQDSVVFPHPYGPPISSYDSTVSSTVSDQSMPTYPATSQMQERASLPSSSSDYTDSRQSSLSFGSDEPQFPTAPSGPAQPPRSSCQWQPGQSVPVDIHALNEQFRQAAQATQNRPSLQHLQSFEQHPAWQSDEALARRGSAATLLAQSMSSVGIHTPAPPSQPTPTPFKSPAPPSDIAARRQRPRPAALGLAALRSQSTDCVGPATAAPIMQQSNSNGAPSLRRIRSSNVVNGVAAGRVMKSLNGSAQRSPMHWSFADALHSPKLVRHLAQTGDGDHLTPPTPLSPRENGWLEHHGQYPFWQSASGTVQRQPGISETELSDGPSYQSIAASMQSLSGSPPHTPVYLRPHFPPPTMEAHVAPENTPPQSAPASQPCFPTGVFATPQAPSPNNQPPTTQPTQLPAHPKASTQPQQQYMNVIVPEPAPQHTNIVFAPQQQMTAEVSGPPPAAPIQFANGVPVVNAEGNVHMAFPQPMQFVSQQQRQSSPIESQYSFNHAPQTTYQFVTAGGGNNAAFPGLTQHHGGVASHGSKPPSATHQPPAELFVHEYNPPDDTKRTAIPRKASEAQVPRNYTFANQTPQHFEGGGPKSKKTGDASTASTSSSNQSKSTSTSPTSSHGSASISSVSAAC